MKDWILVHLTISSRHEKYRRDILYKNLTDESLCFDCCEFLLDLYVFTYQKHQKEAADVCVISRRKQTPPQIAFLHSRSPDFYMGGVGFVK